MKTIILLKLFVGNDIDQQLNEFLTIYKKADIEILDIDYKQTSTDTIKEKTVHDGYYGGTGNTKYKKVSFHDVKTNYSALLKYQVNEAMKEFIDKELKEEADWQEYKKHISVASFEQKANYLYSKSNDAKCLRRANELRDILNGYGYTYDFETNKMKYVGYC